MKTDLKTSTTLLLLVFVVLGVYYSAIFAPLNSVDDMGMYNYLLNNDKFTLRSIFLPGGSGSYYRPVLRASFLADKYVWGLEESFMHLENILFHLANTLLVFAVARRAALLKGAETSMAPFLAALFFAIHPINTEAVNWISGRTDLLAGFFLLLSVLAMLRTPMTLTASCCGAISMLVACLAKETAIFFLPAAILLPFFIASDNGEPPRLLTTLRKQIPHMALFLSTGIGYFLFRNLAFSQGDRGVARVLTHVAGDQGAGVLVNLKLFLKALGFYIKKLVIPFPLNFGITHVSDGYIFLGVLVCAAIIMLLIRRTITSYFYLCAAAIGSSALMIPLLGFTWTPLAERYMYIPAAFFIAGIALSIQGSGYLNKNKKLLQVAVAILAFISLYGTATRNLLWQDNLALFQDTFRKSPDFIPARNEIANALYAQGKVEEAAAIYKSFNDPGDLNNAQYGLMNKAFAYSQEGNYSEARAILKQALSNPGKHEVAILKRLLEVNKFEVMLKKTLPATVYLDNIQALSRLIELTGDPFYEYRLGIVHLQAGNRGKALHAFSRVVSKAPPDVFYRKPAEKLAATLASELSNSGTTGEQKK